MLLWRDKTKEATIMEVLVPFKFLNGFNSKRSVFIIRSRMGLNPKKQFLSQVLFAYVTALINSLAEQHQGLATVLS